MSAIEKAQAFLKISDQFQLGHLMTEGFHPDTGELSYIAKNNLGQALGILQTVDEKSLRLMADKKDLLWNLALDIRDTLQKGHKVFMCGCGATGRLSLVLETLYRQKHGPTEQVFSFMAGGDFALIKSVESFEDRTDFGERQLMELGFGPHDLLLASTEGGETPFVIGAANRAAQYSDRAPYFLYCNPDELLLPIQRSKEVIQNPKIKKLNLTVGPMGISGSTRMQASTVLMLAIGVGLLYEHKGQREFRAFYESFLERLRSTPYQAIGPLTQLEAKLYQEKKYLNYLTDPALAISVLTDTTERSPTFSLRGFENHYDENPGHSLSYLFVQGSESSAEAWSELLKRSPRTVEWKDLDRNIGNTRLLGFDISEKGLRERSQTIPCETFSIRQSQGSTFFSCSGKEIRFAWGDDLFFNHLMTKMILNAHSTLIMGILGRYEGNVMTWVRPSNNKLIDRAARYILQLAGKKGLKAQYPDIVLMIFEGIEELGENDPIVMKVLERLKN